MGAETSEKLKNTAWVVSGAYAIGLITKRGWDSFNHFPSFTDESLLDVDAVIYGFVFILQIAWSWATVRGFEEADLLGKARKSWMSANQGREGKAPKFWLLKHMLLNLPLTFLFFVFVPWLASIALCGGIGKPTLLMYGTWMGMCFGVFLARFDAKRGIATIEPEAIEHTLSNVLGLDGDWGKFITLVVFLALIQGVLQYPNIAQRFGGGKPEPVMVFLKKDVQIKLPSQTEITGQVMDLVFRRGTKIGLKAEKWKGDHVLVIDIDKIEKMYVGKRITELDPTKLK